MPVEGMPRAKLIGRSCLEKLLVINLPMDALGLAEPHSSPNAIRVDSSTR